MLRKALLASAASWSGLSSTTLSAKCTIAYFAGQSSPNYPVVTIRIVETLQRTLLSAETDFGRLDSSVNYLFAAILGVFAGALGNEIIDVKSTPKEFEFEFQRLDGRFSAMRT